VVAHRPGAVDQAGAADRADRTAVDPGGAGGFSAADLAALVGHRFPGGRARVEPSVDRSLREVVVAPPAADDLAHPLAAFLVAQSGIGVGLDEVFALFGSSPADGPMLGEWSVEQIEPLRTGREYQVRATVRGAARKRGASTGVFDLVTVVIDLLGPDRRVHAVVSPTYVFPRRSR
jgi:hypothetical protein